MDEKREAVFGWVVDATAHISDTKSEIGLMGVLGIVAASYLLGVETKYYEALKPIYGSEEGLTPQNGDDQA